MEKKTNLRVLRLRHGISLPQLAAASGLSTQYISRAELGQIAPTQRLEDKLNTAIEAILCNRSAAHSALKNDYQLQKGRLLQKAEGEPDE